MSAPLTAAERQRRSRAQGCPVSVTLRDPEAIRAYRALRAEGLGALSAVEMALRAVWHVYAGVAKMRSTESERVP